MFYSPVCRCVVVKETVLKKRPDPSTSLLFASSAGRMLSGSNASDVSDTSVSSVSGFVRDVEMTFASLVFDWGISVNPGTRFVWEIETRTYAHSPGNSRSDVL